MTDTQNQKPQIEYPCPWGFKVIGAAEDEVRSAIGECLENCIVDDPDSRQFEFGGSKTSGGGKYVSVSITVEVMSEEERNTIFQSFANHPAIKIVI